MVIIVGNGVSVEPRLARHHRALKKLKDTIAASHPSLELEGAGE